MFSSVASPLRLSLAIALALASTPLAAAPVVSKASANIRIAASPLMGVNLSGCEFVDNGALCPTAATIHTYMDKGFTAFRIPFKARQSANAGVIAKLKASTEAAIARGAYVILDLHDYAATFDPAQAAWWIAFMKNFPASDRLMIDTMNEPTKGAGYQPDASGKSYATEVNAGIAAFRKAGLRNILLIEWRGSSGMTRFDKAEGAGKPCISPACSFDRAGGLKDPLGLTMVSGHRYPDANGSGTSATCVADRAARNFVWNTDLAAQARGLRVWVGELAFGNHAKVDPVCDAIGKGIIARMKAMPSVYAGVSWWGGGSGWNEAYIYKIETKKGTFATAAASPYLKTITGRR